MGKKCWDSVADYSSYPESRPKFDQGQATPGETDGGTGSHSPARRKKARFGDGVEIAGNGGTNHSPPPIGRKKARFGDGVESAQDIETVGYGGTDRSYSPPRRGTARSDVAIETVGETQFPDSSRRRSPSSSKDTTRLDSSRPSQPPKGRTGFIIPPPPSNTGDAEPHHRGCSCCKCRATEQSEGDSSSDSSEEVGEDTRPQPSMLDILRELRQSFQPHEPASTAPVITTRPTAPEATTRPTGSKYSHVEYTAPPLTDKGWLYSSYGGRRKGLTSRRKSDRYFQSCLSTGLGSDHCLPLVEQHHLNHLPKFKDVCETGTRFDQGKRSWKPKLMKRLLHRVNRRGKIYRQKRDDLDLATTLAEWERTTLYSKYGHENAITAQGSCWNTMKDRLAEADRKKKSVDHKFS